ncbi:MAG: hypothetical protein ACI8T6_001393, partial [Candidatus Poseidoniaceae archaeon]
QSCPLYIFEVAGISLQVPPALLSCLVRASEKFFGLVVERGIDFMRPFLTFFTHDQ